MDQRRRGRGEAPFSQSFLSGDWNKGHSQWAWNLTRHFISQVVRAFFAATAACRQPLSLFLSLRRTKSMSVSTLSESLSPFHTHACFFSLSLSLTHTLSFPLSQTHTHIHAHFLSTSFVIVLGLAIYSHSLSNWSQISLVSCLWNGWNVCWVYVCVCVRVCLCASVCSEMGT